jgi:hypothetical protein
VTIARSRQVNYRLRVIGPNRIPAGSSARHRLGVPPRLRAKLRAIVRSGYIVTDLTAVPDSDPVNQRTVRFALKR